jgi:nucleotide-binding universal stress UspA family protein
MKRILVASDLSARSEQAIERAVLLVRQHDAELTVLHVVDEDLPADIANRSVEDAKQVLGRTLSAIGNTSGISVHIQTVIGQHYRTIIEQAEQQSVDLVVTGRHREDLILDLFRGSTGERILRAGTCPTLVVKSRPLQSYASVVVGVDFSPPCRKAVEAAVALAPDAEHHLVHAFDIPFRGTLIDDRAIADLTKKHQQQFQDMVDAEAREFLASMPKPIAGNEVRAREGLPADVIIDAAAEFGSDLVVVGTHGRSGLGSALLGSVAESVIDRAPCDVLAVRGW